VVLHRQTYQGGEIKLSSPNHNQPVDQSSEREIHYPGGNRAMPKKLKLASLSLVWDSVSLPVK